MNCKKLVSVLVGCCILMAPLLGNASTPIPAPVAHAHDHEADGHFVSMVDARTLHDGGHTTSAKVGHGCCLSLIGIFSAVHLPQPADSAGGPIPFDPSLSLASRAEGLYRPPRQNS